MKPVKKKAKVKSDRVVLGETVRSLRAKLKLNQSEVAKAIGKSVATVSKIESGDHPVDIDTLVSLAVALKTSAPRLAWSVQKPKLEADPEMSKVVAIFDSLLNTLDGSHKA